MHRVRFDIEIIQLDTTETLSWIINVQRYPSVLTCIFVFKSPVCLEQLGSPTGCCTVSCSDPGSFPTCGPML